MENTTKQETELDTKKLANETAEENAGLFLSPKEALEYCQFKREKFRAEAARAVKETTLDFRTATGGEEEKLLLSTALRLGVKTVMATGNRLPILLPHLKGETVLDALIGGDGSAHIKTKLFEIKTSIKSGAKEVTVAPDPVLLKEENFSELKKRIKHIKRKAKTVPVKLGLHAEYVGLEKLCKLAADCKIGISVPYFKGVEKLKTEILKKAFLQVTDVWDTATFKRLRQAGVDRIGAVDLPSIYDELLKEAEDCALSVPIDGAGGKTVSKAESAALYRAVLHDEI